MSFASKFNTNPNVNPFAYEVPEGVPYVKTADLAQRDGIGKVYPIKSMYINPKGLYGESPVIVSADFQLNAPKHLVDTIKDITQDKDAVRQVDAGMVGFKLYEYKNNKGNQLGVEWVDIDSEDIPF